MNIQTLIDSGANVSVMVSTADLQEFALNLMELARKDEAARLAVASTDERLTPKQVCERYGLSISTLWRWNKLNYLTGTKFGRKMYYSKHEIEKLLNKKV